MDEGTPIAVADRALAPLGLPMSPFVLLQLVGPAVALHIAETLHAAFPDRFQVSENLRRLVAAGKPGLSSGARQARARPGGGRAARRSAPAATAEQVRERALARPGRRVGRMLDEGVVAEPQDLDLCLLLGAGWPFHLGGITPYLDRDGVAEQVRGGGSCRPGWRASPPADAWGLTRGDL